MAGGTKDVASCKIVGGAAFKRMRLRHSPEIAERLIALAAGAFLERREAASD